MIFFFFQILKNMKNFITFTAKREPVLLKKIWASHAEKLLEKESI